MGRTMDGAGHVTRFAPSPTGRLHLGHAYSALVGWQMARLSGGEWRLRIEDIDRARVRPDYADAIFVDLDWLGLAPDGDILVQSRRHAVHAAALESLRARGLVYPCICTRADIARAAQAPHAGETQAYPGTCRKRAIGDDVLERQPFAWRLDLGATGLPMDQAWRDLAAGPQPGRADFAGLQRGRADFAGDPVLFRKDGVPAYHLACVLDDAHQGVTVVTRGADLIESTPVQRLLQQLLGLPEPAYWHHALLTDADGQRLAKRDHAQTLAMLRESGADPAALRAELLRPIAAHFGNQR